MPDVTVIMAVYNGEKYIPTAIESVLGQTCKDLELLCVDDGSTDRTRDRILSFRDDRIKYIFREHSGSPNGPRNAAIMKSKGQYISFIDYDDIYEPDCIAVKLAQIKQNCHVPLVYSDCSVIDQDGQKIHESMIKYMKKSPSEGRCFRELFLGNFIPMQGVMLKKDIFSEIGMFNTFFYAPSDYDLWLRICYKYPISFINLPLASWRTHSSNISKDNFRMDTDMIKCLEMTLSQFSDCEAIIGRKALQNRMHRVYFDAAYGLLKNGDWETARKYFAKSLLWGKKPHSVPLLVKAFALEFLFRIGYKKFPSSK